LAVAVVLVITVVVAVLAVGSITKQRLLFLES
jgi:hypothetical protein